MKKNLIIIDFLLLLTKENEIDPYIRGLIENDYRNDYRLINEESTLVIQPFIEKIRVNGFYTDSGCVYYRLKDEKYFLDYREEYVEIDFTILLKEIDNYPLPYKKPRGMIIKGDFYYYVSLIGIEYPQSYVLYNVFPIQLYQQELKLRLELLCLQSNIDIEIINIGTIGFYLLPRQYKKTQIISKLPFQDYSKIFFLGKYNSHNREIMENPKIKDIEIQNREELKYFLETY